MMKRRFTILTAAFALLTFLSFPMGMWGQETSTLTFTAACGGSGTADDGAEWTVTSDGTESTYDSNKGIHYGTNSAQVKYIQLSTSDISGTITKVVVNASTASGVTATVGVTVGGSAFGGSAQNLSTTATNYTFNGSASGEIVVLITKPSKAAKALYCKSIAVTYTAGPATYTVTYNGNGNTGGNVPVDDTEYDDDNNIVTVLGPGNLTKTGHTFEWWSDMEDGTDEDAILYEEDDIFEITENTTLYAQWSVNTYNYSLSITGVDDEAMAELKVDGSTVAQGAKIAYDKEVTVVVVTNTGYNYSIAVKDANNTDIPVANDKFTMPASDVTVTVTTVLIPTYTITFETGTGASVPQISDLEGSTITLPTATPSEACASRGWEFAGWATTSVSETTNAPTLLSGDYTITADADLHAVYKVTEGDGGTTEFNFAEIAAANDWENGVAYTEVTIAPVTIEAQGDGNNGKWYTSSGGSWRIYSGGAVLVSTTSNNVTAVISSPSCDFTINNGTASYSPSARTDFTSITVTYGTSTTTYNSNPSCLPMVATPTFTPAAGTYTGAQNVTIECDTDGATIQYKTTEEGVWQNYSEAIPVSTTTTIWAKATNDGMDDSEVAEATYTIQYTLTVDIDDVVEYFLYDNSNETWDEITLDENGQALVSSGADIRISGGEVYDDCYEVESFDVTDGNDDPVTVVDNTDEDGTYSFTMPASNATLSAQVEAVTYTIQYSVNGAVVAGLTQTVNCGSSATLPTTGITVPEGYTFAGWSTSESNTTRVPSYTPTADATLYAVFASNDVTTKTYSFTISTADFNKQSYDANNGTHTSVATASTSETMDVTWTTSNVMLSNDGASIQWRKSPVGSLSATDLGTIISVDIDETSDNALTLSSSGGSFSIDNNGKATGYASTVEVVFEKSTTSYYTLVKDVTGTETMANIEACHLITVKGGGILTLTGTNNGTATNLVIANGGQLISNSSVAATMQKNVAACTYNNQNNAGYVLIASPLGIAPGNVTNMTTGDYDLYAYYGNLTGEEWQNYKAQSFANLGRGRGYLYANGALTTLEFAGNIDGNFSGVSLNYNSTYTLGSLNLVGNPFSYTRAFSVMNGNNTVNANYLTMNSTGSGFVSGVLSTSLDLDPMEAIFVQATAENESFKVYTSAKGNEPKESNGFVNLTVSRDRGAVIDNAIVRFDEGLMLNKLRISENATELYFAMEGSDYSIVNANGRSEMPVNFKAENNGTYTLSVNAENVDMTYLHLIDNMTGADIDLLATPSYSFEAKTSDYASRFRLVFNANNGNNENGNETFAYYNGSEWIINNSDNATLQVIDMMGRVLSSQTLNGNANVTLNQAAGIYMLRLVNGENVKVQKVVVR